MYEVSNFSVLQFHRYLFKKQSYGTYLRTSTSEKIIPLSTEFQIKYQIVSADGEVDLVDTQSQNSIDLELAFLGSKKG